ncbi:MAG: hypothetical protein WD512_17090, partial [Candidatus Paceibacterota bacterium]
MINSHEAGIKWGNNVSVSQDDKLSGTLNNSDSINNAVIKYENNQAVDVSGYDKNTSDKNVSIESIEFYG